MSGETLRYTRPERIPMKGHATFNERWVQERIAADPAILGLGELILKDRERIQPRAGRLDLLLQDAETDRRYEVELQLGPTDESHIIRTLEYWDLERQRFPQYDHCAVIVAEDVTSRFLNVIKLFNGHIPLVALQASALRMGDHVGLVFTTVMDEMNRGLEEEEGDSEPTDRNYWETNQGSKATLALADRVLQLIKPIAPDLEPKYNKFYIGLAKDGQPNNFVIFRPKKHHLRMEPRLKPSDEIQRIIGSAGLDAMGYDKRWGRYRLRLTREDLEKGQAAVIQLLQMAHAAAPGE
ncbi:MAG: hypothetical protein ACYDBQ_06135 [Thermoplasmatota archaeon]